MSLIVERYYPISVALIAGAVAWKFQVPFPDDQKEFLAAALGLGAVLTGFIATAQSILMALPSESVMGRLRSSGYIEDLVRYMAEALYAGIGYCFLNLLGFYIAFHKDYYLQFSPVWIAASIYSVLTFMRVTKVMMRIMRSP